MYPKVIRTRVAEGGVIHVVDKELPPGEVDIVVVPHHGKKLPQHRSIEVNRLPIGGYKAGWLSPQQLRRKALYEDA